MYRETKWAENALGTPTFKLADLKNKTGFARRARRTQRKDRRKLVGPTSSRSVSLGRPSERLGTPTFKLACSKESSHGDHEGHKEERYLGELTPGLCFLCALCVLCAKHLCFFEKTCRTKVRRFQPALSQNCLLCYNNRIFLRSFPNRAIGLLALRGCRFITSSRSSYNRRNYSTSGFFRPV